MSTRRRFHCIWAQVMWDTQSSTTHQNLGGPGTIYTLKFWHIYSSLWLRVALTGGSSAPKHDKQDHESPIIREWLSSQLRFFSEIFHYKCGVLLAMSRYWQCSRFFYSVQRQGIQIFQLDARLSEEIDTTSWSFDTKAVFLGGKNGW